MVLKAVTNKVVPIARGFSTSAKVDKYGHSYRGVVGSNLPFQIDNRYRLLFTGILFIGSGLGLPFLMMRHAIKSKNT